MANAGAGCDEHNELITTMSANSRSSNSSSSSNSDNARSNESIGVTCVICWERYKRLDNICAVNCGHVFHWECLEHWLEESQDRKCPVCRSRDVNYFKIFLAFDETDQTEIAEPRGGLENEINNDDSGDAHDVQNLIQEAELYRDEIEYLNNHIKYLTTLLTDSD